MNPRNALPLLLLLAACQPSPPDADVAAPAPPAPVETPAPAQVPGDDPAPPPEGLAPRAFACHGNEPFWSLDVGESTGLLTTPEGETALDGRLKAIEGGAFAFQGAAVDDPAAVTGILMSPAQCFDTMADGPAEAFSAVLSLPDGRTGNGCCSARYGLDAASAPVADAAGKPEDDWSRFLPELSGAIERCAQDGGVATQAVLRAWPMNHGKAGVRLVDADGARFDCIADLGDGSIEDVQPAAEGEPLPEEGQPRWLPVQDEPPVVDCGRLERVMAGDTLQGYLLYDFGCD